MRKPQTLAPAPSLPRLHRRIHRRNFLQVGSLGSLGLTLSAYLRTASAGEVTATAKARSAILVFLGGGPSHHETFDPKPAAAAEIRGEFGVVDTKVAGVKFSDAVPLLAAQMEHLAILRTVTHRQSAHEPGVAYMMTGHAFGPGHDFASLGAVAGHECHERSREIGLPPYFALPNDPLGGGGGHLGPSFNALPVPGDPSDPQFRVQDLTPPPAVTAEHMARRQKLLADVNANFRQSRVSNVRVAVDRFTEQAYSLMTSPRAQAAFDITREEDKTRDRYGRTGFGQRLLLARRLVESSVPFVTVFDGDWDDHTNIFPNLKKRLPGFDRGLSALLEDLAQRGLLDTTLVIAMGEFGRTPKINPNRGRDHWSDAFSVLLAGGGVRGGQVIGVSDEEGAFPKDRPIKPEELFHSIYMLLGIDPEKFLPSTGGRDVPIVRDGKFIPELTG